MKGLIITGLVIILAVLTGTIAKGEVLGLWLFDERQGNLAQDSSGNGNDGTIEGATYVPGQYGTALKFNGDDFVDIPLPQSLEGKTEEAYTVEVWVKIDKAPPADHSTIIFWHQPMVLGFTSSTGGGLYGYVGGTSKITDPDGPDRSPIGEWFHVAQTYDGKTQKLYRNGEEIASQEVAVTPSYEQVVWTIGAPEARDQMFLESAVLDELRVLNEALPPEELGFFNRFSAVKPTGKLTTSWANVKAGKYYGH